MAASVDDLNKQAEALISARSEQETIWRDCAEASYPLLSSGFHSDLTPTDAQSKQADLLDSTSTSACNILSSNIVGGMTPANARWFSMVVDGLSDSSAAWLDSASTELWTRIHEANFDAAAFEGVQTMCPMGWFAMYIDENQTGDGLHFNIWPASQVFYRSSKAGQPVDTILRKFKMTAEQAVNAYGESMVSDDVRRMVREGRGHEKIELRWMIYPRKNYTPGSSVSNRLPFASCAWEVGTKKLIRESGYHEFPLVLPRWKLMPGSDYAVGPVFDALPDIRQLNDLLFNENAATDLAIAGMWIAEDDGVLNPQTIKVGPRKVIAANSVDSIKPLLTGSDFNVSFSKKEELQRAIRTTLMAEQLQPPSDPRMTATEWLGRMALLRQMLGPTFGRLQSEWLQPLIVRCFGLAMRGGAFAHLGPVPEELRDTSYTIRYQSPLARSQKLEEVAAMDRFEADLAASVQVRAEVLDLYDWDEAKRLKAELLGVPVKLLRNARDVKADREARVKQQQEQQQQAMMQQAAAATINASAQRMAKA
jgi:hypothetical protein